MLLRFPFYCCGDRIGRGSRVVENAGKLWETGGFSRNNIVVLRIHDGAESISV